MRGVDVDCSSDQWQSIREMTQLRGSKFAVGALAGAGLFMIAAISCQSAIAADARLEAYRKQAEEREIERMMRSGANAPRIADTKGCAGTARSVRQEAGYTYRFLHDCPDGAPEGRGLLFVINDQGVPDTAHELTYRKGVDITNNIHAHRWNFLAFGTDYFNEPARFFGPKGELLQRDAVGGGLVMLLIQASHQGSAAATQALLKLIDNSNDGQLSRLEALVGELPEINDEARQIWQKRVARALAPNDNKATCQTEAIENFVSDFLRVVNHVATTGGQYDWLHYSMRKRIEYEAYEGDALTRDLRQAEAKGKLDKLRAFLRSAQQVKGRAPSFECGFATVWRDKLRGDAYDGKRLSFAIGPDYLGRKQGLQPVRLAPPIPGWTGQVSDKSGLTPRPEEFGYKVFSYPFDPVCRFPNGCLPIQTVEVEPVSPEQARSIRAISQAAGGGRLGIKTIGPFMDGDVTEQKIDRLVVYNPDNPTQQIVLNRVQMKARP